MFGFGKKRVEPAPPHPELVPLTEEECQPNIDLSRLHTSSRDYSSEEVENALASGYPRGDILEYCHANGINWKKRVKR
jgi:hypothetical protein